MLYEIFNFKIATIKYNYNSYHKKGDISGTQRSFS